MVGYVDASWGDDSDTSRSTAGFLFLLYGDVISFKSMLQKCVALSTCEAEYVAAAEAAREAIWLHAVISEICPGLPMPITINEDNQGAIALSKNPVGHGKNKHIALRHHFLRELCICLAGKIRLTYCNTVGQLADFFTKPLGRLRFLTLRKLILGQ